MGRVSPPDDALSAALVIARALEDAELPHAIGGILACGLYGVSRGTLDVDVNVFVELDQLETVLDVFRGLGVEADSDKARAEATEGLVVLQWGPYRIDMFLPSIEFAWEAMRTRVTHDVDGHPVYFLSAEAIAVFKLLFFRPKDIGDLGRLVSVHAPLDIAYVRKKIVDMMGEDDERVERWDELVAHFRQA